MKTGSDLNNTREPSRLIAGIIAAILLVSCGGSEESPEEAVRAWVDRGVEAARNKDRRALVDMVSPSYTDGRGQDREDLGNLLRFYFLRQEKVAFVSRIENLAVHGDSAADLVVLVGMAGTNDTSALGFSADGMRFEMELVRDGDDWLLLSARWGRPGSEVY